MAGTIVSINLFYSGTATFCLGLLFFKMQESRTAVFKMLVRSLGIVVVSSKLNDVNKKMAEGP